MCHTINITDDNIREGNETFSVIVSSPDDPVEFRMSTTVVTIKDNDEVLVELEQQSYEIDEDDSNVELNATLQICVILTGEIETPVSVAVTSVNSTAT
ncbi:hypothetical protein GBAR_LOCUS189, partial [Geodia barretti]